jgi:Protein of unknown function (DUF2813)
MIKIEVANFRSIRSADIEVDNIALVMARNTAGKTSLAQAVAAALLGDKKVYGATQKDMSTVITTGQEVASVAVDSFDWHRGITWPGELSEDGMAPPCDEITTGRINPPADFKGKDWADFIRKLAGARVRVTKEEIEARIKGFDGATDQLVAEAMKLIRDMDAGAAVAADRAGKHRTKWEKITGDRFGTDKAAQWGAGLASRADELGELRANVDAILKAHQQAMAREALAGQSGDDLKSEIFILKKEIAELGVEVAKEDKTIEVLNAEFRSYPSVAIQDCPHCKQKLTVHGDKIVAAKPNEKNRGSKEFGQLVSDLGIAGERKARLASELGGKKAKLEMAETTKKKIDDSDGLGASATDLELEYAKASGELNDIAAAVEAAQAFHNWEFWKAAETFFGPQGIRWELTQEALKGLAPRFEELAGQIFKGFDVKLEITPERAEVLFDGRSFSAMSWKGDPNSYRLGLQIIFQLLQAERLGAGVLVIIDRFDTLDAERRGAVMRYLAKSKWPALILQTQATGEKPDADKLAIAKVGRTYWLEGGEVTSL